MLHTELAGRRTSRLGFGCGRLNGGAGARESIALVEAALALGIRHFDVAPSYGMGLAENVLGDALTGVADATVATKAGIGRPSNPGAKALLRQLLLPVLAATPGLKARLAKRAGGGSVRGQFAPEQVEASLADSLSRLKRSSVDAFLLHQPTPDDLTPALTATMERILADGRARAAGSGTNDDARALVPFGSVSQMRVDVAAPLPAEGDLILHGAMRHHPVPATLSPEQLQAMRALGRDPADPAAWTGLMLTLALASAPKAILLVSARSPARLRSAVESIDWTLAEGADETMLAQLRQLAAS